MLVYHGGQTAVKGTYWDISTGLRIDVADEKVLPGGGGTVYCRVPAIGILAAAPLLGLAYAVFLPFIGIAMLVRIAIGRFAGPVADVLRTSVMFGWRPTESYLTGRRKKTAVKQGGSGKTSGA